MAAYTSPTEDLQDLECLQCGYSLQGLVTPRCPECGRTFDPCDWTTYGVRGNHGFATTWPMYVSLSGWVALGLMLWFHDVEAIVALLALYVFVWAVLGLPLAIWSGVNNHQYAVLKLDRFFLKIAVASGVGFYVFVLWMLFF